MSAPQRGLGLPMMLFAVLAVAIVAGAGLFVGFADQRALPLPSAIWDPAATDPASVPVVRFTRTVAIDGAASGATLRIASSETARFLLDGTNVCTAPPGGKMAEAELGRLSSGSHTLVIEALVPPGGGQVVACVDLSDGRRIVTDGGWDARVGNDGFTRFATVTAGYGEQPLGEALGKLPVTTAESKGARFWLPLVCLLAAMAVACFAGPLLRPADRSRPDTRLVDMAVVWPSILYASAAFCITALASAAVSPAVIAGLHVVSTAVFVLVLVAWKSGSQFIERDQELHRAELSGYDAMLGAADLVAATIADQPVELQQAIAAKANDLAEAVRFASTSSLTSDIDRQILAALTELDEKLSGGALDAGLFGQHADRIMSMLRRREAIAQASRRA